jgi:hypothetical protein
MNGRQPLEIISIVQPNRCHMNMVIVVCLNWISRASLMPVSDMASGIMLDGREVGQNKKNKVFLLCLIPYKKCCIYHSFVEQYI